MWHSGSENRDNVYSENCPLILSPASLLMKLRRVTSAISGKLFWSSLLISATLVADVNQWVPEDLTARAEEEYDYSAGRRIDDWRRMMERVANY